MVLAITIKNTIDPENCAETKEYLSELCYIEDINYVLCYHCQSAVTIYNEDCSKLEGALDEPCPDGGDLSYLTLFYIKAFLATLINIFLALSGSTDVPRRIDDEEACQELKNHLGYQCYQEGLDDETCTNCKYSVEFYNDMCTNLTGALNEPCAKKYN